MDLDSDLNSDCGDEIVTNGAAAVDHEVDDGEQEIDHITQSLHKTHLIDTLPVDTGDVEVDIIEHPTSGQVTDDNPREEEYDTQEEYEHLTHVDSEQGTAQNEVEYIECLKGENEDKLDELEAEEMLNITPDDAETLQEPDVLQEPEESQHSDIETEIPEDICTKTDTLQELDTEFEPDQLVESDLGSKQEDQTEEPIEEFPAVVEDKQGEVTSPIDSGIVDIESVPNTPVSTNEEATDDLLNLNHPDCDKPIVIDDLVKIVPSQNQTSDQPSMKDVDNDTLDEPSMNDDGKAKEIEALNSRVRDLEQTLQNKDMQISLLQEEVTKLNAEVASKSVPTTKKMATKPKPSSAKTTPTNKPAAKKTVTNGTAKRIGSATSPNKTTTASTRPKPARPVSGVKGPAKPSKSGTSTAANKKASKGPHKMELVRGVDGEEHAVKLFLRGRGIVCYPPTDFSMADVKSDKPEEQLSINWVYGYRGRDSQDNIFVLPSGEILYYQAAVGVIYNPDTDTQRFYQGHNDDIKCIALNPVDPSIVATGQAAGHDEKEGDPHVRVWNSQTLETIAVLGMGEMQRAVSSVSFSADGTKLMAVDEGNDHTIYLFDLAKNAKITSQKGHQDPVVGAEFLDGSSDKFVSYGKGHIIFWEYENGKLTKKTGIFEKNPKPRFMTALAFLEDGTAVSGDSSGNLFLWSTENRKITKSKVGAHEGTIYSIAIKDNEIYTGGQDCKVKRFSAQFEELDVWQLDSKAHSRVRAIAFCGEKLAIGTYNNGLLLGTFGGEPTQPIYGHGSGDLWGGAAHPTENSFATAGQDKVVYIWDAATHQPKRTFNVERPAQACCFSPCGSVLAVASTTGEWLIMDSDTGAVLSEYKSGPEQIDAIAFSPDGSMIAVGSHDNFTYLFKSEDLRSQYKAIGKCTGHSSYVTHLDFSEDGKVIQTTSGDYEHLFWNSENSDQITNTKDLRDTQMATYTCTLGFPVCGIWPVGYDGTDINSVCRSNNSKLVATADDFGLVNLFKYPCCDPTAEWSSFRGHSAHVTKVRFLPGDKELVTLGGRDQSIIQWGCA